MEGKVLARVAAVLFVAVVLTATVIEMTREEVNVPAPSAPLLQPSADPLRQGQRRCQEMGEAAAGDAECLRIWAETRDRFLGREPEALAPASTSAGQ